MGVGALFPEKSDDTFLFDIVHMDVMNAQSADNRPMAAENSRLSSMTRN
jgi:hypothetical protein